MVVVCRGVLATHSFWSLAEFQFCKKNYFNSLSDDFIKTNICTNERACHNGY